MSTKERAKSHLNEKYSRELLKRQLPLEWVFREYSPDYGIDLNIELFSETNGKYYTQGEHIYIQLKSVEKAKILKYKIIERCNIEKLPLPGYEVKRKNYEIDVVKYQIETSLLEMVERMGSAVPMLLVIVDISTENIYYVCLNDYIEKVIIPLKPQYSKQKSITLNIPVRNKLNDTTGRSVIEWYAKRPKLFAFFNKVSYQCSELQYSGGDLELAHHFATILSRLDAWSAAKYFPALAQVKDDFFYFYEHGRPKELESILIRLREMGEDIEAEEWEGNDFSKLVSLSEATKTQCIAGLWSRMDNVGNIFEDLIKEADLPTYMGYDMSLK